MHIVFASRYICTIDSYCRLAIICVLRMYSTYHSALLETASMANYVIAIAIIVGIICGQALSVIEDADRNFLGLNLPYGRGLDSELQLARLMLATPRFYHSKRNTELINSLLGLPKNMNNAGK